MTRIRSEFGVVGTEWVFLVWSGAFGGSDLPPGN